MIQEPSLRFAVKYALRWFRFFPPCYVLPETLIVILEIFAPTIAGTIQQGQPALPVDSEWNNTYRVAQGMTPIPTGADTWTTVIQIIGDEDIYGEAVIVEPDGGGEGEEAFMDFNDSKLSGPNAAGYNYVTPRIVVNVWMWPSVRFVYGPAYRPWVSPWRWSYYPTWWKPWRPYGWQVWHPYRMHYHNPFVVVRTHRVINAHRFYTPFRTSSVTVRTRHASTVGNYRVTRSRTTVTGPRGNKATVRKTTVQGPRGNKATKVKVRRH